MALRGSVILILHAMVRLLVTILLLGCTDSNTTLSSRDTPHATEGTELAIASWEAQQELPGLRFACIAKIRRARYTIVDSFEELSDECNQPGKLNACVYVGAPRVILYKPNITAGLIRHELLHVLTGCNQNEDPAASNAHADSRVWSGWGADGYHGQPIDGCGGIQ